MVFDRLAERRIREAMSEGKFDGLPRRGAIDLEDYFKLPPELRMAYSILKCAGCVPEEVELLRDVDRLETELAAAPDESRRASFRRELANARLKLDLALERARRQRSSRDAAFAD
jgi:DnaJ-like protein